jgi:hypothetical protein
VTDKLLAARCGLREGCALASLNGEPLGALSVDEVRARLGAALPARSAAQPLRLVAHLPEPPALGGGALVVEALPAFVEALRAMAFWLDPRIWSPATPGRVCKYVAKGFECALPGVRREAFKQRPFAMIRQAQTTFVNHEPVSRHDPPAGLNLPPFKMAEEQGEVRCPLGQLESRGMGVLIDAEAEVMRFRGADPRKLYLDERHGSGVAGGVITGRLRDAEATAIASKIYATLGTSGEKQAISDEYSYGGSRTNPSVSPPLPCHDPRTYAHDARSRTLP